MWLHGYLLFTVQIKALNKHSVQQTFNYFCLLCFNDAVICASFDHFDIAFNYYVFILCISFDLFNMK